ncbi:hypothetical protein RJ639_029290 [Escallonia herrerae]|uniref:NPH3 domain-containing protein n=1 Tax=Escallonia herrerae TaxID=1293975 RepID=A0AA88X459_9ASTE|nr:hypothetical protein RJ639_029290 [Escallonia herrerae]
MSKSNRLQKQVSKANEENPDEIDLVQLPGGPKAFEICAKFCYGITVTLNPYNVVAARCAAEYLEMNEDVDRGNLIFKIEVFLNSSVLRSWKDSIIVLQTTTSLRPWSEDLKVVGRCIDSIASQISVETSFINWSYNQKLTLPDKVVNNEMKFKERIDSVPKDWWIEDICELEIDLYKRIMITVKSEGRIDGILIGEALKTYAVRWLPDSIDALVSEVHNKRNKVLVETIICLLPSDKGIGCACNFLLKLLKVAVLVGADESLREDLINTVSLKLNEASVDDLLIQAVSPQTTTYDVGLVQCLINRFGMNEKRSLDFDSGERKTKRTGEVVFGYGSWLNVGNLIDQYLAEIASDPSLSLTSFIDLSKSIPESARPIHDGLYWAIDIYLKEHPSLTKAERKELCGLMDVKKLAINASMHAAQNDLLPLRVVVQVLFYEQVRAAAEVQALSNSIRDASRSASNTEDDSAKTVPERSISLPRQTSQRELRDEDPLKNGKLIKKGSEKRRSGLQLLPSRSRRIFDKLWVVARGHEHGENRSSETSASSKSPISMIQGETKSSGSSSRNRRYSIS